MIETLYMNYLEKLLPGILTYFMVAMLLYMLWGVLKAISMILEWLAYEYRYIEFGRFSLGSISDKLEVVVCGYFTVITCILGAIFAAGLIWFILFSLLYIFSSVVSL